MDNLKTLMDKKDYDLVLKLTETATDNNSLFYRISAFLGSGKSKEALAVIETNQKTLESNLSILIKIHVEILCLLNRFDDARKQLKYYENLPYESQIVEEILREMPKLIDTEEKKITSFKSISNEEIIKNLASNNENDVLIALDMIRDKDGLYFLPYIKKVLVNFPKQSIRSFALLLLVQKEIDREVEFKSIDKIIKVNPKHLIPPFVGDNFNNLLSKMQLEYKDPSLSEHAIQILSSYLLYIYPSNVEESEDILLSALYIVALDFMKMRTEDSVKYIANIKNQSETEINKLADKIDKALEDF